MLEEELDSECDAILQRMETALCSDPYPTLPPPLASKRQQEPPAQEQPHADDEAMDWEHIPEDVRRLLESETQDVFSQQLESCANHSAHDDYVRWESWLDQLLKDTEEIETNISQYKEKLNALLQLNGKVKSESDTLSSGATNLLSTKEKLERVLQSTEHKLNYFYDIDAASNTIHIPQMSPFHESFVRAVQKLDDGERFLSTHKHYQSTATYLNRVFVAKQKALTIIRDVITQRISSATAQVLASPNYKQALLFTSASENGGADEGGAKEALDISVEAAMVGNVGVCTVLNVEFRSKLQDVLPLIGILQERCKATSTSGGGNRDIRVILEGVVSQYVTSRSKILRPLLLEFIKFLQRNMASFLDPPQLKHLASGGVAYLLSLTVEENVLLHAVWNPTNSSAIATLIKTYLTSIVESVSQELYDAYRSEVLREDDIKALCFLVDCLSASLLEGKVKSAGEIGKFVAPVIQRMIEDTQERLYFRSHMFIKDVLTPFMYTGKEVIQFIQNDQQKIVSAMFPPLENCLYLLSMLYNSISKDVFCTVAEEAMRITVGSIVRVGSILKSLDSVQEALLHSLLFQLKAMLRMREQITPFDVSFSVQERGLDVGTLVKQRHVAIHITARDAKKMLEDEIRQSCETFIHTVAGNIVGYIRQILDALARTQTPAPTTITEVSETVVPEVIKRALHVRDDLLKSYLTNTMTCSVLWKPITSQIFEEYKRLHSLIVDTFGNQESCTELLQKLPLPNQLVLSIA
eukprot:PhF_6_TR15101/c0_g1_i1/m.23769/K20290/COG3, SEC34; conserved oligomeric Golgi complex subunit 3